MSSNGTFSERLADYVTGMAFGDLPPDVVDKTKLCILDTIGCMLAGSRDPVGVMITAHALRYGHPGPCTIFGHRESVGPEHAALANGTSAHVLELDDGHRPSDNHVGGVVVPAALAMAQATGASGSELLLAVTLGYDVMGRVGEAVCLPRKGQPFHGTGTTGVFGSAAAAGKLLGLAAGQLANALGVAGDGASGLKEYAESGVDCKPLHTGRAAQSGITAAYLAAEGFQGPATILEGQYGFCNAMTHEPRPELICAELGQRFAVVESGFKIHASTGGTRAGIIDAAVWLRKAHDLDPGSIQRIRVALPGGGQEESQRRRGRPTTVASARYSTSFAVAAAFQDGEVTHRQHTTGKLADPGIASLEERIEFITDPEVDQIFEAQKRDEPFFFTPCAVEVEFGGRIYRRVERSPLGYDPKRGLTQAQAVVKFRSLVDGILSKTQAAGVVDWVLKLDQDSKVGDFASLFKYETTAKAR
jgi:2-methylcitrate dehydratase PrpD